MIYVVLLPSVFRSETYLNKLKAWYGKPVSVLLRKTPLVEKQSDLQTCYLEALFFCSVKINQHIVRSLTL